MYHVIQASEASEQASKQASKQANIVKYSKTLFSHAVILRFHAYKL